MEQWMSVKDAAKELGLCTQTVRRYIEIGKLQATQIIPRGKMRISVTSIENLVKPEEKNG